MTFKNRLVWIHDKDKDGQRVLVPLKSRCMEVTQAVSYSASVSEPSALSSGPLASSSVFQIPAASEPSTRSGPTASASSFSIMCGDEGFYQ